MTPEQEHILLELMEKLDIKLEKIQNSWWSRAAIIYGILILWLSAITVWVKQVDTYNRDTNTEISKMETETKTIEMELEYHIKETVTIPNTQK